MRLLESCTLFHKESAIHFETWLDLEGKQLPIELIIVTVSTNGMEHLNVLNAFIDLNHVQKTLRAEFLG